MLRTSIAAVALLLTVVLFAGTSSARTSRANAYGASLRVTPAPYVVPGQLNAYTVNVFNLQTAAWSNVLLKVYLPHQTISKPLSTIGDSSVLPSAFHNHFSGSHAQWGLKKLTSQGGFSLSLRAMVARGLTGKLCGGNMVLTVGGKLAAQKTMRCIPIRQA